MADYLRCARAEQCLRWGLKDVFGEMQMNDKDQLPDLAKQCYAVINDIASRLTPEDRARLRTMYATEPPMIYWTLLAQVPVAQAEDQTTEAVWRVVLMLLGRMRPGKAGVGRLLRQTELPEPRVQQLLGSTGETLRTLITETARWLLAHDVTTGAIDQLATLGLADAMADHATREWVRRRIALDYVRAKS